MEEETLSLRPYLSTLTLLCVEPSNVLTTIYHGLFAILFKEVIFTKNAEDAIEIYENQKIDIIITAQVFDGISGMNMIKHIRKEDKEIPIIFVSSFDDVELLTQALLLKVTGFIKKPFETTDMLDSVENATKQILAKKYLLEKQEKKITSLKNKLDYSDYQENLSFQKALKIVRNDFYYKQLKEDENSITLLDFLYTAKDVISGDTYSARKIDENKTLFFIIDGMGKGLSASISAMMTGTFLNRRIDANIEENIPFCIQSIIKKTLSHTQKILLDDEILSISFVLIDAKKETLEYALFSMPAILMQNTKNEILSLKSNNPPVSAYTQNFKTDVFSYHSIIKMLIYSDGLVENSLKDEKETYAKHIKEDFRNSTTREELRKKIISKIAKQEDDITFILISHIPLKHPKHSLCINSTLNETQKANEWFENIINQETQNLSLQSNSGLAFMELLMNAYEHGNLGLSGNKKHSLIDKDIYFDFLAQKELTCKKKIFIDIYSFKNYLFIKIKDEGEGFDTTSLSTVFGVNKNFNRRGIFMSRNATLGIYYNNVANQITFIVKLDS